MILGQVRQSWLTKPHAEFWTGGPGLGTRKFFSADPQRITTIFEEIVTDAAGNWLNSGKWRMFILNGEGLWVHRNWITPVQPIDRNPATGWGPASGDGDIAQLKTDLATAMDRIRRKDAKAEELRGI